MKLFIEFFITLFIFIIYEPSFVMAQIYYTKNNDSSAYDINNIEEYKKFIRMINELKYAVETSMMRKKYDCINTFGHEQYCDCIMQNLPVGIMSFSQYVILVTSTKEELNYEKMPDTDKDLVDLSISTRDICVNRTFHSKGQFSQNTQIEYQKVRVEGQEWNHKDWTTIHNADLVRYTTHGSSVWDNKFGLIKKKNSCDNDILWIMWSTYDKSIQQFSNIETKIEIDIDGTSFRIPVDMHVYRQSTPLLSVAVFTNFLAGPNFIELLEKWVGAERGSRRPVSPHLPLKPCVRLSHSHGFRLQVSFQLPWHSQTPRYIPQGIVR